MPKQIVKIDAETQTVTLGHPGVLTFEIKLDPWPASQEEIERQAIEQCHEIPTDPANFWVDDAVGAVEL